MYFLEKQTRNTLRVDLAEYVPSPSTNCVYLFLGNETLFRAVVNQLHFIHPKCCIRISFPKSITG